MDEQALAALTQPQLVHLVKALQARVAALEAEVSALRGGAPPKTPTNSSVPPAKGWKPRRPRGEHRAAHPRRGPKPGHPGTSRHRVPSAVIDLVLPCRPDRCAACGHPLPSGG